MLPGRRSRWTNSRMPSSPATIRQASPLDMVRRAPAGAPTFRTGGRNCGRPARGCGGCWVPAAAQPWQQPPDQLRTRDAHVLHPDGRRLSYAQLATRAATLVSAPADVPLKPRGAYRIIGQPTRVTDAREIVTGAAAYGTDAAIPGALTAVIARCPYFDGAVAQLDDTQARRVAGVRQVFRIPGPQPGAALDRNLAAGVAGVEGGFWLGPQGSEGVR